LDLPTHKIQSSRGEEGDSGLKLSLRPVPKFLGAAPLVWFCHPRSDSSSAGCLRHEWAPQAFLVSFKLETDETLLIPKAESAIQHYGVHAVVSASSPSCLSELMPLRQVANELLSRAERVTIVSRGEAFHVEELRRGSQGVELERSIVEAVSRKHDRWLAG